MSKYYVLVDDQNYVRQFTISDIPQAGHIELDYSIGECPQPGYKFNIVSKQWEDAQSPEEKQIEYARIAVEKRSRLLTATDWTQLPDVPLATKEAWATYRQSLRDITAQPGYPFTITWPVKPT